MTYGDGEPSLDANGVLTEDDMRAIREEPSRLKRQVALIRLVELAYDRGWRDATKQWTTYADTLETPVAQA